MSDGGVHEATSLGLSKIMRCYNISFKKPYRTGPIGYQAGFAAGLPFEPARAVIDSFDVEPVRRTVLRTKRVISKALVELPLPRECEMLYSYIGAM